MLVLINSDLLSLFCKSRTTSTVAFASKSSGKLEAKDAVEKMEKTLQHAEKRSDHKTISLSTKLYTSQIALVYLTNTGDSLLSYASLIRT